MKLVSYVTKNAPDARAGILSGDKIVDLSRGLEEKRAHSHDVRDVEARGLLAFIERAATLRHHADARAADPPASCSLPLSRATLVSPLPRPPSMRDGYAFRQHVET